MKDSKIWKRFGGGLMQTEYICGLPVDNLTYDDIAEDLKKILYTREKMIITSVNPQITLQADSVPEVRAYINRATHRIPDGVGVVKMSKVLGGSITERITGVDVMNICLKFANAFNQRIFLYGAKNEIVEKAVKNIQSKYPNIQVVGYQHGYTKKEQQEIVNKINQARPDFLFVALGSPKQEVFLERTIDQLDARVFLDVGGTFDVLSGVVKRAPAFYIHTNTEWLYRSLKYKRYDRLMQIPLFLIKAYRMKKQTQTFAKNTESQEILEKNATIQSKVQGEKKL